MFEGGEMLSDEKAQQTPSRAATAPSSAPTPPVPRRSSKRSRRRFSAKQDADARSVKSAKMQSSNEKENVPPVPQRRKGSQEDITALPISRKLESSPHLRPADLERPHIPYNFRPYSSSQTSLQRGEARPSRPQTLRSRRSGTPSRRRSTKKPTNDRLREEEIRAMSMPIPVPKRPGDSGPMRRDSKKRRGMRDSNVSLPAEDSIHSAMSGVVEQRGWEVGSLDVFNPRPAVRLSGAPQYVAPGSAPSTSYMSRDTSRKEKDKMPVTRSSARKPRTIGEEADDLDSGDLRVLMERDAKRKERRDKERQEKLDKKLRERRGRNRGDSDKKLREAEEVRRADEARRRADEQQIARDVITPPTDVHPALRDRPAVSGAEAVGLGIGAGDGVAPIDPGHAHAHAMPTTEEEGTTNTGTYLNYPAQGDIPENPFADPQPQSATAEAERSSSVPGPFTPVETPMEDPVVSTAQAVRMSQAPTPPLSPVRTDQRVRSGLSQVQSGDLPEPPPIPADRRASEPRRAGAWATFFRRGGTNLKKPGDEGPTTPSEFSFSNTSRESMRGQPLPAHLVGTQPSLRRKSGTPMRSKSKFREDLGDDAPISPPDSRMPTPDVTEMAAAAAAARRGKRSPRPVDVPGARSETPDPATIGRNDTPISPGQRGHGLMSASLASVDSEGSWLAGTGKRQSTQSALSRSMGSLSKRRPEFNASYEELGGDKDAEYFRRMSPSPAILEQSRLSGPALAGASPDDEESLYEEDNEVPTPGDPLTVHSSVRRKPTLVHRDPRVKSREGLLAEYASGETAEPAEATPGKDESDEAEDVPEAQMHSAKSVDYGMKGHHARQISAGSAKLLDIAPKRSLDVGSRDSLGSAPPASRTSQL